MPPPRVTSFLSGADWAAKGPQIPAQRFYGAYASAIKESDLSAHGKHQFYAENAIFHNQNGVDYHGAEIWPWIVKLFGEFARLEHDFHAVWELENENDTVHLIARVTRHIWAPGSDIAGSPTVSLPLSMTCEIGPSTGPEETPEGLQYRHVWMYWDTYPLQPHFPKNAVVFSPINTERESGVGK
ncbi:uncharacterized protein N7511_007307 [Penicillium nucicola]|uniref:uncharacterized protein n=1 Tax=Penicillium nucicola TaxID=1850975 RepID=UPI002544D5F8|nr:uncharacterized protein N7511_007307 [Penicillium nucicola]KAJ5757125.1 hypothetical protein N7511_007307 [Penicillium nucicola]